MRIEHVRPERRHRSTAKGAGMDSVIIRSTPTCFAIMAVGPIPGDADMASAMSIARECGSGRVMTVFLVLLGVGLVVLGALVLIRYPDRPGGTIRWHKLEISSKGAGLPLIVVGVVVATAAVIVPATHPGATGGDSSDSAGGPPQIPGLDVVPSTTCTNTFFAQDPPVEARRIRSVELGALDRRVLAVGEPEDTEFGMVFSDTVSAPTPRVLGAMKLSHRPDLGFQVAATVDEQTCQPAGLALASDPGLPAPTALGNYVWVTFRLASTPYVLLLNSSNASTEVLVRFNKK
jgi:hypothetical protein